MMKTCTMCKVEFPKTLEYFSKNGKYLRNQCKACNKIRITAWKKANQDKIKAGSKVYREANAERIKKVSATWEKANSKKRYAATKSWRKENPEKVSAMNKAWRALNPENERARSNKRRALILGNGHTPYTEEQVLKTYGTNCNICSLTVDLIAARRVGIPGWENGLHIDHLIPISKGGPDTLENVRPTHGLCNITKHNKEIYENQTT